MNKDFNEIELRKFDLNLLLVFSAIMNEGSVGAAAKRLYIGPSAISMALNRLRDAVGDPLFVRSGNGVVPTPRAERLWDEVRPALGTINSAVRPKSFDPATSETSFRLGVPDDLEFLLVPRLLARLALIAPSVRLIVQPIDFRNMFARLDDGGVDVGLSALPARPIEARHRVKVLQQETFSVLYDARHEAISDTRSMAGFLATPQILVSIAGDLSGPIDTALTKRSLSRTLIGSVARFATIPFILRHRPVLACVPRTSAAYLSREFDLKAEQLPFPSPQFDLGLAWHSRTDADPAHLWFRQIVEEEVSALTTTLP
ncbi:MAG: LysR family transcriptional regulator [Pseudomonadota bacterium]